MKIEEIKRAFDNYVKNYDLGNYDIAYKYKHSYRVKEISRQLGKSLNLDKENILLAEVIGLLHDIGRFKQIELFNNFKDSNIDHGTLGVKILFEDKIINDFNIDSKYNDVIAFAIENHNKLKISENYDSEKLLHAKLIRDADKLDILRAYIIYKDYKIKESDEPISKKVEEDFFENKQTLNKNISNLNDDIIQSLSFIFDINFKETLDIIKKENLIDKFFEIIKQKDIFEKYFKYIKKHIDERIDENVR